MIKGGVENMTLQEIVSLMMEDGSYFVEKDAEIPKTVQAKNHKKKRIAKKWAKRYGYKIIYETKRAKVMDVTIDNVIEFCLANQLALPNEFLITTQND